MKPSACLIRRTALSYIVTYSTASPLVLEIESTSPEELAVAVLDLLESRKSLTGDGRSRIVYCPDPRSTLFAGGELGDLSKKSDRQQLKYLAESLLPLDAEQMAADFIIRDKEVRVVAIDHASIVPIVDAFHRHGLHFRWIAPGPLLALQQATMELGLGEEVIVWDEPDHCDVWLIDGSGPQRWNHIAGDPSTRAVWLKLFTTQVPESYSWLVMNSTSDTREILESLSEVNPRLVQTDAQSVWLAKAADRLSQGTESAWFDLRDGPVAGGDRWRTLYGWMALAATAALAMFCALPLACWWKSQRLASRLEAIEEAERRLFLKSFPGQLMPPDVSGFITQKLIEARGAREGGGEFEPTISALHVLHVALTALVEEKEFVIDRFEIESGELNTEIRLPSFEDIPPLTTRMQSLGLQVPTPESRRNPDGTVTATFRGAMKRRAVSTKSGSREPMDDLTIESEVNR